MGRGFEGLMLKAWRAEDYRLTVTSTEYISEKYMRLGFAAGGLLADHPLHPTQWVRLWIPNGEREHQRGYTLVDPDPAGDEFSIEFAVHHGPASMWAQNAAVGDQIDVSVLGSDFHLPDPLPSEFVIFGDTASLPAINSLLDAIGDSPARVWLEWQYESDTGLPVRNKPHHQVNWVQRIDDGRLLREQAHEMDCPKDTYAWVACDGHTTRSIVRSLKTTHGLPKTSIKSRAYWK
ncbi:siderophore-interacting protein [Nocardia sp. CA-107356]|uniref:siderophore-interacting protein n=1 Tax=Nocardia sp. CA-107356 TaxID=3239972 RepID=UPI003D8F8282